jgi:hypothetical protein
LFTKSREDNRLNYSSEASQSKTHAEIKISSKHQTIGLFCRDVYDLFSHAIREEDIRINRESLVAAIVMLVGLHLLLFLF